MSWLKRLAQRTIRSASLLWVVLGKKISTHQEAFFESIMPAPRKPILDKSKSRYLVIILITVLASIFVHMTGTSSPIENKKLFSFPSSIGEWKSQQIQMGRNIYQSLETDYAFMRDYYSPNYKIPVNLAVVWFDDRYFAFHAPESCLGGVGNTVKEKKIVPVILMNKKYYVGKLVVEKDGVRQIVLYFNDAEGFITTSQSALRMNILLKRLFFRRSSVSFIRLMAPVEHNDNDTISILQTFLKDFYPLMPAYTYVGKIDK